VSWATGEAGEIERAVVAAAGSTPEALIQAAKICGFRGERRSLRVPLADLHWTLDDSALTLSFALPPGAYATSVLRELMKTPELG
jgi:tRNA pseudouridine13 synthase